MRIRHFSGYGCVNAKKVSLDDEKLVVHVWGNHERGIYMSDVYDIFNWLVKRFDKNHTDYRQIVDVETDAYYEDDENIYYEDDENIYYEDDEKLLTQHCIYVIRFFKT